jgi:tRNA(Arg) A34 adenosine deaminase TadA
MTRDQMLAYLRAADEVAREAAGHGHHPFGCVLVGSDDRILMRQGNIDTVRHAETELCRRAAAAYPADFLWTCTLVSTGEPCAMCTAVRSIGRISAAWSMASKRRSSSRRPATTPRTRP